MKFNTLNKMYYFVYKFNRVFVCTSHAIKSALLIKIRKNCKECNLQPRIEFLFLQIIFKNLFNNVYLHK
jgi:hypothetical protein